MANVIGDRPPGDLLVPIGHHNTVSQARPLGRTVFGFIHFVSDDSLSTTVIFMSRVGGPRVSRRVQRPGAVELWETSWDSRISSRLIANRNFSNVLCDSFLFFFFFEQRATLFPFPRAMRPRSQPFETVISPGLVFTRVSETSSEISLKAARTILSRELFSSSDVPTNYAVPLPFLPIFNACICGPSRDTAIQFAYPTACARDTCHGDLIKIPDGHGPLKNTTLRACNRVTRIVSFTLPLRCGV